MIDLPESSRHPLLRRFLDDLSELLPHVWDILQSHPDLNPDVRTAMSDLPGPLRERLVQLVAALESGNYDSILEEHGLTEGPELAFKLAGYNGSRSEYQAWLAAQAEAAPLEEEPADDQDEPADEEERRWRRWLRKIKKPLGWANVLLKSLSLIPGGGAVEELKDGTEKVIDDLTP